MPASPASRAARRQSRSTNSSGWRCSHIRRTSPRSRSTSQSSRIGGTVMYCRPYSPVIPSQWSSIATETVAPSSASSRRRRIRSTAPKNRPSTAAPGSAIRPQQGAPHHVVVDLAHGSAGQDGPIRRQEYGRGLGWAGLAGAARLGLLGLGLDARAGLARAGSQRRQLRGGEPVGLATAAPGRGAPGSAGSPSPALGTAVSIGGAVRPAPGRHRCARRTSRFRPVPAAAAGAGPDSVSTGARCHCPHRQGPS